jgi:hypothetical protein
MDSNVTDAVRPEKMRGLASHWYGIIGPVNPDTEAVRLCLIKFGLEFLRSCREGERKESRRVVGAATSRPPQANANANGTWC